MRKAARFFDDADSKVFAQYAAGMHAREEHYVGALVALVGQDLAKAGLGWIVKSAGAWEESEWGVDLIVGVKVAGGLKPLTFQVKRLRADWDRLVNGTSRFQAQLRRMQTSGRFVPYAMFIPRPRGPNLLPFDTCTTVGRAAPFFRLGESLAGVVWDDARVGAVFGGRAAPRRLGELIDDAMACDIGKGRLIPGRLQGSTVVYDWPVAGGAVPLRDDGGEAEPEGLLEAAEASRAAAFVWVDATRRRRSRRTPRRVLGRGEPGVRD